MVWSFNAYCPAKHLVTVEIDPWGRVLVPDPCPSCSATPLPRKPGRLRIWREARRFRRQFRWPPV